MDFDERARRYRDDPHGDLGDDHQTRDEFFRFVDDLLESPTEIYRSFRRGRSTGGSLEGAIRRVDDRLDQLSLMRRLLASYEEHLNERRARLLHVSEEYEAPYDGPRWMEDDQPPPRREFRSAFNQPPEPDRPG